MNCFPSQLISSLQNVQGFDETLFTEIHNSDKQITSIRFNQHKVSKETLKQDNLRNKIFRPEIEGKVAWSDNGYYLSQRPLFYLDPLWHAGVYYVQEPSSMCLEFVLKHICEIQGSLRVLDLCAAPGGKSTLLAGLLPAESIVVCNEVISSRTHILEENIIKWGLPNVIVTQNDARDFTGLKEYFDVILVDAPCSGSGLFRKDPDSIKEWSPEQVSLCSQRQKRILKDIIPSLKKDGLLIYTTCSFSQEENEDIGDYIIQQLLLENIPVPFKPDWNILETHSLVTYSKGYRFYPYKLKGEGFFLSCFKKLNEGGNTENTTFRKQKKQNILPGISSAQKSILEQWINEVNDFIYFPLNNSITAFPKLFQQELTTILSQLKVVYAGIKMGKIVGRDLIPDQALAVSINKNKAIHSIDFDLSDGIKYLRKEPLNLNEMPEGWMLATYQDYGLGWLKGILNRINNYYPVNWRIRK